MLTCYYCQRDGVPCMHVSQADMDAYATPNNNHTKEN